MDTLARLLDSLFAWRQQLRGALAQSLPDAIGATLADHERRLARLEAIVGPELEPVEQPAIGPGWPFDPAPHAAPV